MFCKKSLSAKTCAITCISINTHITKAKGSVAITLMRLFVFISSLLTPNTGSFYKYPVHSRDKELKEIHPLKDSCIL